MKKLCFPVSYVDPAALIVVLTRTQKRNDVIPLTGNLQAHPAHPVLHVKWTSSHRLPWLCLPLSLSFLLQ